MAFVPLLPSAISERIRAKLVVVVPVYNEAQNIASFLKEWEICLSKFEPDYQILLIDDESKDSSLSILLDLDSASENLVVVTKPNSGHGRTCRLGYSACASAPSVDWILQIDSDGQCDPEFFCQFWKQRETADCIFGERVIRDDGILRTLTSKICRFASTLLCGTNMVDPNVPYRLIRKSTLAQAIKLIPASFDIHNVALTFTLKRTEGLRWKYVPIRFRVRQGGSNSINLLNVVHLGVSMLFDLAKLRK